MLTNLRAAREAAGLTQQQLSNKIHLSIRTISEIECGKLVKIADPDKNARAEKFIKSQKGR